MAAMTSVWRVRRAAFGRRCGGEADRPPRQGLLHLEDWADLHGSDVSRGTLGGVLDGLVQVLGLDHVEADHLVAGLVERTRFGLGLAVTDANGLRGLRPLHRVTGFEHAL